MKEKQIEEMAKAMHDGCCVVKATNQCRGEDCLDCGAVILYEKGYRKASDVAREIFEEIESCKWSETQYGDQILCFEINSEKYAELKKKYESEKDDG